MHIITITASKNIYNIYIYDIYIYVYIYIYIESSGIRFYISKIKNIDILEYIGQPIYIYIYIYIILAEKTQSIISFLLRFLFKIF